MSNSSSSSSSTKKMVFALLVRMGVATAIVAAAVPTGSSTISEVGVNPEKHDVYYDLYSSEGAYIGALGGFFGSLCLLCCACKCTDDEFMGAEIMISVIMSVIAGSGGTALAALALHGKEGLALASHRKQELALASFYSALVGEAILVPLVFLAAVLSAMIFGGLCSGEERNASSDGAFAQALSMPLLTEDGEPAAEELHV